jgi:hypothetical protein
MLDWSFSETDKNHLTAAAKNVIHLTTLQRMCPVFYLSALRDAAEHFAARGRYPFFDYRTAKNLTHDATSQGSSKLAKRWQSCKRHRLRTPDLLFATGN